LPGQGSGRATVLAHQALHEGLRQQQRVAFALAQRRQRHRQHVKAEQQVAAEQAARHEGVEVGVGGGHQAQVGLLDARAAQGAVAVVLRKAQQRRLRTRAQRVDLVEEQRAALGQADHAAAGGLGVGESASHVAEEFGLEDGVGYGAAIDGDERFAATIAEIVDGARGEFLAGASLTTQQHGGIDGGALLQHGQRLPEDHRVADEVERAPIGLFLRLRRHHDAPSRKR
jgi:hypothetical protein